MNKFLFKLTPGQLNEKPSDIIIVPTIKSLTMERTIKN